MSIIFRNVRRNILSQVLFSHNRKSTMDNKKNFQSFSFFPNKGKIKLHCELLLILIHARDRKSVLVHMPLKYKFSPSVILVFLRLTHSRSLFIAIETFFPTIMAEQHKARHKRENQIEIDFRSDDNLNQFVPSFYSSIHAVGSNELWHWRRTIVDSTSLRKAFLRLSLPS